MCDRETDVFTIDFGVREHGEEKNGADGKAFFGALRRGAV